MNRNWLYGGIVPVCSNCDRVKLYLDGALKTEADPDRTTFKHLKYPPFMVNLSELPLDPWGDPDRRLSWRQESNIEELIRQGRRRAIAG